MEEHHISFTFTSRFYQSDPITEATKEVWFVLHGYGQLAQFFIRKFAKLREAGICVIAPEGLSRYYQQGSSGRVGASWMTKEDRLTDIVNYTSYLNEVYDSAIPENFRGKIKVLGFSQGAATASRWVVNHTIHVDALILWAGLLPPDLNIEQGKEVLKKLKVYFVYGTQDPYLNDERFREMKRLVNELGLDPVTLMFDGAHDIDEGTLLKLIKKSVEGFGH